MAKAIFPIANGFYESDSLPISAQECVNCYPNLVAVPALSQETLFGTAGLNQLATSGAIGNNRGAHVLAGVPYFVNGSKLYRLETDNTLTDLGAISGTGRVSLADNGTQLCILVPGGDGYIFTTSPDTLTQITDVDFTANGNPQHVAFIDGYFVFTTDTKKFIISAINDGLSYNALDYGTAEADPDDTVAPVVFKNQLFIGGSQTMEAFQNVGGADFPFQRSGLFLSKGISSPFSPVLAQDTFMWVGGGENESPAIWAFTGNTAEKVSTTAIDTLLQREPNIDTVFSWSYAQKGAYFVGFVLTETVLVFDMISKRWHERKSMIAGDLSRFRANSVIQAYDKVLVGDSVDGRVGELDIDLYTEYGEEIHRTISTQPFVNDNVGEPMFINSIELTVESGVGDSTTPDPQIGMDVSRDGGKTYTDKRFRSLGKVGEYDHRVIWRRLGRIPRFVVLRFTMTDPVKPVIISLSADLTV